MYTLPQAFRVSLPQPSTLQVGGTAHFALQTDHLIEERPEERPSLRRSYSRSCWPAPFRRATRAASDPLSSATCEANELPIQHPSKHECPRCPSDSERTTNCLPPLPSWEWGHFEIRPLARESRTARACVQAPTFGCSLALTLSLSNTHAYTINPSS